MLEPIDRLSLVDPAPCWSTHMARRGHTDGVVSACVTPDGQHVVTASYDNTARVWLLVEV